MRMFPCVDVIVFVVAVEDVEEVAVVLVEFLESNTLKNFKFSSPPTVARVVPSGDS